MTTDKLEREINRSQASLANKVPHNHKEELLLAGNQKRVEVLKVILQYQHQDILKSKVEEIAVLTD
jgi:hypothetical protein